MAFQILEYLFSVQRPCLQLKLFQCAVILFQKAEITQIPIQHSKPLYRFS